MRVGIPSCSEFFIRYTGCIANGFSRLSGYESSRRFLKSRYIGVFRHSMAVLSDNSVTLVLRRSVIAGRQYSDTCRRVGRLSSETCREWIKHISNCIDVNLKENVLKIYFVTVAFDQYRASHLAFPLTKFYYNYHNGTVVLDCVLITEFHNHYTPAGLYQFWPCDCSVNGTLLISGTV